MYLMYLSKFMKNKYYKILQKKKQNQLKVISLRDAQVCGKLKSNELINEYCTTEIGHIISSHIYFIVRCYKK